MVETAPKSFAHSITVDGARLAYDEMGAGETIVLLHGYPQSRRAWRHHTGALSANHRVIALDWFGWGDSERSPTMRYDVDSEITRLGRVLDGLQIERCDLFAHDYGGYLGLGFVLEHPERVRRLALINSRAHRFFPGVYGALTRAVCAMARSGIGPRILQSAPLYWIHHVAMQDEVRRGTFDTALVEHYVGWLRTSEGRRFWIAFFATYEVATRKHVTSSLDRIDCPTAVVWGTDDPWCPIDIAEELTAGISGAVLTRLEGAHHFSMEERPVEVLAALEALLRRAARR